MYYGSNSATVEAIKVTSACTVKIGNGGHCNVYCNSSSKKGCLYATNASVKVYINTDGYLYATGSYCVNLTASSSLSVSKCHAGSNSRYPFYKSGAKVTTSSLMRRF